MNLLERILELTEEKSDIAQSIKFYVENIKSDWVYNTYSTNLFNFYESNVSSEDDEEYEGNADEWYASAISSTEVEDETVDDVIEKAKKDLKANYNEEIFLKYFLKRFNFLET